MPLQETPKHSQVGLPQSPMVSLFLSPESWACIKFCLYPPRVCFPQSYGSSVIKSCWPSKSYSLGIPSPWLDPQAEEPDTGPRTFTTVQELLGYYCSPVCELPTWQVRICFFHNCVSPTILLWLLLCPWMWSIFFWQVPVSSCRQLFNS